MTPIQPDEKLLDSELGGQSLIILPMRVLLLIVLIAMFPLRGFASVGMQTSMGAMLLQQASATAESAQAPAQASAAAAASDAPMSMHCCAQCSVCELSHVLIGEAPAAMAPVAPSHPKAPTHLFVRFASADVRTAHKPPLAAR